MRGCCGWPSGTLEPARGSSPASRRLLSVAWPQHRPSPWSAQTSASADKSHAIGFALAQLRLTFLPDVPKHRAGGSRRPGRRLERHDLHVVPEAQPGANARPGSPAHLQMQHDRVVLQPPAQGAPPTAAHPEPLRAGSEVRSENVSASAPVEHHCGGLAAAPAVSPHPGCGPRAARRRGLQAPSPRLPQRQVLPLHRQFVSAGRWWEEAERGHSCHHGKAR